MVLGVGPHLALAGKRGGLEFGAIAIGARARAGAGREHDSSAPSALGADEGVGLGGGEPPFDRRNSLCGCHGSQCSGVRGEALHNGHADRWGLETGLDAGGRNSNDDLAS